MLLKGRYFIVIYLNLLDFDIFMYIAEDGWIKNIRQCRSPNFDQRPQNELIRLIVIHCIALPPEHYGGNDIEAFFCNKLDASKHPFFEEIKDLKVSAHLLIKRTGELIQFVSFNDRAWHAGVSCYKGQERCNDFSIGIELEGSDKSPYTHEQYHVLNKVIGSLLETYPELTRDNIVGHNEIAPGRKTDPGDFFEWDKILCRCK